MVYAHCNVNVFFLFYSAVSDEAEDSPVVLICCRPRHRNRGFGNRRSVLYLTTSDCSLHLDESEFTRLRFA